MKFWRVLSMSKIRRTILQFLYDMEDSAKNIKKYAEPLTFEEFSQNDLIVGYIERQLEKIGEAINHIQKLDAELLLIANKNKKYWENIKGVRNRLIHEYWGTSLEMIYDISTDEMDELLEYVTKLKELISVEKQ